MQIIQSKMIHNLGHTVPKKNMIVYKFLDLDIISALNI